MPYRKQIRVAVLLRELVQRLPTDLQGGLPARQRPNARPSPGERTGEGSTSLLEYLREHAKP